MVDPPLARTGPAIHRFRGWRKVVMLAGWNCCALFFLVLVAELVARLYVAYAGVATHFEPRPFHGFGQTDPVLWWRLRSHLDVVTQGVYLRTNSRGFRDDREAIPKDVLLGVCLGDSTTYGWKVQLDQMYTAVAERMLNADGGNRFSLVSAGVPGYSSYQCLRQFETAVQPLHPKWIGLLIGNNESRARSMGDRERGRLLAREEKLDRFLGFSRLWTLLSRAPDTLHRSFELDPPPGRVANTPEEYRENLRELIDKARASGCRIIVLGVPLRLRFKPFWKTYDRHSPAVAELLRRAETARNNGEPADRQARLLEKAVQLEPEQFEAHWRLAEVETQLGRPEAAARQFALARDGDLHPEAAKPRYNAVLEALCREERVPFVDLDRAFTRSGFAEDELFQDHCHASAVGHKIIAQALADAVRKLFPSP